MHARPCHDGGMGRQERQRDKAVVMQNLAPAIVALILLLANAVLWAVKPFGPDHIGAGLVLALALFLCVLKYRQPRVPEARDIHRPQG